MLKIAIIGTGFIGNTHAQACKNSTKLKLAAIVDNKQQACKAAAEKYDCNYYEDAEEMMDQEDVDIVDICLPTFLHEKYVTMAARKGRHIICEKPAALTFDSMERMMAAVEAAGVKFMVAQVVRFWPEYVKIKELYDRGEFGKIKMIYANRLAQHPNWTSWHKDPEKSGGALFDLHLHDIDFMVSMLGKVKTVYAVGWRTDTKCWNHIVTSMIFESGEQAVIEGSYGMPEGYPFTTNFRVVGEDAGIEYLMKAGLNLEKIEAASRSLIYFDQKNQPQHVYVDTAEEPYQAELEYFANCIENNRAIEKVSLESSREVLKVVLAIQQSLEMNAVVNFEGKMSD